MKEYNYYELLIGSFFMLAMIFTGPISMLAVIMDMQWIKLWKELFIFLIFIISLCLFKCKNISFNILFILFVFIFELLYNCIKGIPFEYIAYAWKTDFVLYLFSFALYLTFKSKKISSRKLDLMLKIIIIGGVINAVAGIGETLFLANLLDLLGVAKLGRETGVLIATFGGELRPPGLQMGIVHYATLLVFSYIVFIENSRLYKGKKRKFIHCVFLVAIFSSTYFTAILFMAIYFGLKLGQIAFYNDKFDKYSYWIMLLVCVIFMGLLSVSVDFANLFYEINPHKFDASISPRIRQFNYVFEDVSSSIGNSILGAGYGIYGTGGLESKSNIMGSMAIDSGFLYLLGNYGYIGVFGFLILIISIIFKNRNKDYIGIKYILFYVLGIEFFFNNAFRDFPSNYILIMLIALNHFYAKTVKED